MCLSAHSIQMFNICQFKCNRNLNEIGMRLKVQFSAILKTSFWVMVSIIAGILTATAQDAASEENAAANSNDQVMAADKAQEDKQPVPRFVSLKFDTIKVRVGPDSNKYKVAWIYKKKGLPVEVIADYDQWRRIRGVNGETGWVLKNQLDSKRSAMTVPWVKDDYLFAMRKTPDDQGVLVAEVQSKVIGTVRSCNGTWCELDIQGYRGWLKQAELWGVYPEEEIKK